MGSIVERALLPWAQRMKTRVNLPVRLSWGERGASSLALGDFDQPQVEIREREQVVTTTISAEALASHRARFPAMLDADAFHLDVQA
mgnify:CR=1 FL=1